MLKGTAQMKQKSKNAALNGTMDSSSFCWRSDWVSRYESLWSLLHKFAFLNAVKADSIREIFGANPNVTAWSSMWLNRNRDDLRYLDGLDQAKLAEVFRLKEKIVGESVVTSFVKRNEVQTLSCASLRYCRTCLQNGFHSAIYQLLFLVKCPVHAEKFVTTCVNCENEIPYRLTQKAFKLPYGCSACKFMPRLIMPAERDIQLIKESELRNSQLRLISNWLVYRFKAETVEKLVQQDKNYELNVLQINRKFSKELSSNITSNLIDYWLDVFNPTPRLRKILEKQVAKVKDIHIKIILKSKMVESPQKADLFGVLWDRELYSIFKSISRYLVKTQLKKHINCIKEYGRNIWWDKYAVSSKGRICPSANAFILWRMYYEDLDHPIKLFKKFKGFIMSKPRICWIPPNYNLSETILKRIFALECYWLFYECKLLAESLSLQKLYSFNRRALTTRYFPHWIILPNSDKAECSEIHWWVKKDRLKTLKNTINAVTITKGKACQHF
jgi:hypothetical protein